MYNQYQGHSQRRGGHRCMSSLVNFLLSNKLEKVSWNCTKTSYFVYCISVILNAPLVMSSCKFCLQLLVPRPPMELCLWTLLGVFHPTDPPVDPLEQILGLHSWQSPSSWSSFIQQASKHTWRALILNFDIRWCRCATTSRRCRRRSCSV